MQDLKQFSFEELMAHLEQLVGAMERGDMPLEKLLENYEKGSVMLKECRSRLDHFQKKIEVLRKDDGANGVWQDFTPENSRAVNALNEAEVKVPPPAPQQPPKYEPTDGLPF